MAQGNEFGPTGGRWMTETKLRALFAAGLTYDEIADANERSEGWRPTRSGVKRKYERMGMPSRRGSHRDLIPWKIAPEHNDSIFRYMLQAESRSRQHRPLSETDRKLIARLQELLFGRGKLMVVDYHPDLGFVLREREEWDEDIVRMPRADRYSDPGVAEKAREEAAESPAPAPAKRSRAPSRGGAASETQPSGTV